MMPRRTLLGAALLVACSHCALGADNFATQGLNLKMKLRKPYCFYEDVKVPGTKFFMSWDVTVGGQEDLSVWIDGPEDHEQIYSASNDPTGRVLFKAPHAGFYKICFDNTLSAVAEKTVKFNVALGDPMDGQVKMALGPLKFEVLHKPNPVERSILRVAEGLKEIKDNQDYLRTRERIHRDTVEDSNTRVVLWSVIEGATLVAASILQVWYLRRCFERRSQV